jgi:hypothetical protein
MPEPIITALSALVGAIIGAVARPWGQDYVKRKADERERKQAARRSRIARIERIVELFTGNRGDGTVGRSYGATANGLTELPAAAAAVDDRQLSEAVGRFIAAPLGSSERTSQRNNALARAGTLLNQEEREGLAVVLVPPDVPPNRWTRTNAAAPRGRIARTIRRHPARLVPTLNQLVGSSSLPRLTSTLTVEWPTFRPFSGAVLPGRRDARLTRPAPVHRSIRTWT